MTGQRCWEIFSGRRQQRHKKQGNRPDIAAEQSDQGFDDSVQPR